MITIIKVKCIDQTLTLEHTPVIASGGLNEDRVEFEFCSKWDGFLLTAVFWRSEKDVYHVRLDEANGCLVPPEVTTDEGVVYFGVFGVNDEGVQRTSNVLMYHVEKGAITTGTKPSDPTPDIYTQIMNEFLNFEKEIRDSQTAFEGRMSEAWGAYQATLTQRQTTFENSLAQQQTTFESSMAQQQTAYETDLTQQWENFKTGGDFVLKTTYEQDMPNKADKGHKHSASDITSGVLSAARGGTGVDSFDKLSSALGVAVVPYLAFVTNANVDSINAAFGMNNEATVKCIGKALAMYAWFKGESNSTYPYTELQKCNTLTEIFNNLKAFRELVSSVNLESLLQTSTYITSNRKDELEKSYFNDLCYRYGYGQYSTYDSFCANANLSTFVNSKEQLAYAYKCPPFLLALENSTRAVNALKGSSLITTLSKSGSGTQGAGTQTYATKGFITANAGTFRYFTSNSILNIVSGNTSELNRFQGPAQLKMNISSGSSSYPAWTQSWTGIVIE